MKIGTYQRKRLRIPNNNPRKRKANLTQEDIELLRMSGIEATTEQPKKIPKPQKPRQYKPSKQERIRIKLLRMIKASRQGRLTCKYKTLDKLNP